MTNHFSQGCREVMRPHKCLGPNDISGMAKATVNTFCVLTFYVKSNARKDKPPLKGRRQGT